MFVKADNRSFQQELTQEQNQEQQQPSPPPEGPPNSGPAPITTDALSRVPASSPAKRKHSAGSSVATNGSLRDDLGDVDLTFTDDGGSRRSFEYNYDGNYDGDGDGDSGDTFGFGGRRSGSYSSQDAQPTTSHHEYSHQPQHQHAGSDNSQSIKLGGLVESLANFQTHDAAAAAAPEAAARAPEMQERGRDAGPPRLFNGGGTGTDNSGAVDMMDMDIDMNLDTAGTQNQQDQTQDQNQTQNKDQQGGGP